MRRSRRLRRNSDFQRVRRKGRAWKHPLLVLVIAAREEASAESRVGITVSRRVGGAVVRNRIKRRLREIMRLDYASLPAGHDYVLIVRPFAARADYQALQMAVSELLGRAKARA